MSYHVINIDTPDCSVTCSKGQLICREKEKAVVKTIPIEDVAAIVITSFSAHLNSRVLLECGHHGVALIVCEKFKPVSLLLPANRSSDTLLTKAALSLPRRTAATLWRKTIDAKCLNQVSLARHLQPNHSKLIMLEKTARHPSSRKESVCARYFWQVFAAAIGTQTFRRERRAGEANDLLNFGYAILLSQILQKLFAFGLDPTVGISHQIRERSTPLAYDIMEPFRPFVEYRVTRWLREESGEAAVTPTFRRYMTGFLLEPVIYSNQQMPFNQCVEQVVRSFRKAVNTQKTTPYRPWTAPNSRWDG